MQRVVVLGGGTGGTMVANLLGRRLRHEVEAGRLDLVQVVESPLHTYQPGFLYMAFGLAPLDHYQRDQRSLLLPSVRLEVDRAVAIDPDAGRIHTLSGRAIGYDFLVLATGAVPTPSAVPGMAEGAHGFYTGQDALRLRDALATFERGRILLTVDVPHKCPVAPLEMTLTLDDYFRRLGRREQVELVYTYPIGRLHSLASVADWVGGLFEERGIRSETFFNLEAVEPGTQKVRSLEGTEYDYDLLISVPPHRGAQVIQTSELGDADGFVPTHRETLQALDHPNIYVLGDATNLPVSKAGSTAHYQADVVAENLVANLAGKPAPFRYDGKVFCFIEAGEEAASYITFNYRQPPRPARPSPVLHWFKVAYNEIYWLSARGVL
ncbi:NAD(P)/FAD-dependent oxidoreductase [Limnochorda pilosa]|uniref:FAD-dependent pyridine nucleotide-disulfide oxidoreductase n=1 Tax=Limnochorda pilosa TaxID=1555112 RepID=A0A0K2SJ92_LIMPI|nr:FAD/NAD(P)-binding oxidoreductase [Limnochorda pilosa]BAS27186.1 FAD-dependent pyridine nucleotide-disulfide oxidoreductase [Limnochorda pilosa]